MNELQIQRFKKVLLIAGSLLILGVIYAVIIYNNRTGIPCVFQQITGYKCMTCGITTMFYDLMHGNFLDAIADNPVIFFSLPVLLIILSRKLYAYITVSTSYQFNLLEKILCIIIIIFFILLLLMRNSFI